MKNTENNIAREALKEMLRRDLYIARTEKDVKKILKEEKAFGAIDKISTYRWEAHFSPEKIQFILGMWRAEQGISYGLYEILKRYSNAIFVNVEPMADVDDEGYASYPQPSDGPCDVDLYDTETAILEQLERYGNKPGSYSWDYSIRHFGFLHDRSVVVTIAEKDCDHEEDYLVVTVTPEKQGRPCYRKECDFGSLYETLVALAAKEA